TPGCFPEIPQQDIQDGGARSADLQTAGPGAVQNFEPVRLDLEKGFVAGQFLRGLSPRRQRQPRRRVRFDFVQQTLHLPLTLIPNQIQRKRSALECRAQEVEGCIYWDLRSSGA